MGIRFNCCLLLLAATSCGTLAQTSSPKNPLGHGSEVAKAGQGLFNKTCTVCHGMDGGEGERAPALVGDRRFFRLSEGALYDTIKNGIPGTGMPALGLPDDDIWKIVAFIRAMRSSASEVDVPGEVELGRVVFTGKGGCIKCHILNGKGGTIGPDLSNIGAQITFKRLKESLTTDGPIAPGYQLVEVVTQSGERVEGIAKNIDGFSIQLLDYQNRLHLLDRSQLRSVVVSEVSLMPHNYDKTLTAEEYQGLLAMLSRQVMQPLHKKIEGDGEAGR